MPNPKDKSAKRPSTPIGFLGRALERVADEEAEPEEQKELRRLAGEFLERDSQDHASRQPSSAAGIKASQDDSLPRGIDTLQPQEKAFHPVTSPTELLGLALEHAVKKHEKDPIARKEALELAEKWKREGRSN